MQRVRTIAAAAPAAIEWFAFGLFAGLVWGMAGYLFG